MPSSHSAAAVLVHQERLFNNLSSFRELEQRIQALHDQNTKAVGDAFEIFIEAYLATQVTFQAERVWIVGQVPAQVRQQLNLPADAKGIDGVFQTHSGELATGSDFYILTILKIFGVLDLAGAGSSPEWTNRAPPCLNNGSSLELSN